MVVQEESKVWELFVSLLKNKETTGDFASGDAFSEVYGCVKVVVYDAPIFGILPGDT